MTHYKVQEWPDMASSPSSTRLGDAIIFSSDWPAEDWEHQRSWSDAWAWIGGNAMPGDTIEVLAPVAGTRDDNYTGP